MKFSVLTHAQRVRAARGSLSLTGYVEWVLGDLRQKSAMHVVTELDPRQRRAVRAQCVQHRIRRSRRVLRSATIRLRTLTGDRTEFIGRNGIAAKPAAMSRARLSGQSRRGARSVRRDPDHRSNSADGSSAKSSSGSAPADGIERSAATWCSAFAGPAPRATRSNARARLLETHARRDPGPDARSGLDVLANGWLLYQTLACRLWARSGYYQSGGAYGFRDQLQDVDGARATPRRDCCASRSCSAPARSSRKATCSTGGIRRPGAACARDVPTIISGCRSRSCRYVTCTGDTRRAGRTQCRFSKDARSAPDEESYYDLPTHIGRQRRRCTSIACARSSTACSFGAHGLPLMGCGDWNDGMNLVGDARQRRKRMARVFPVSTC